MKRKLWVAAALLLLLLSACGQTGFDGSRVANDDCFLLDYQVLNCSDSHTLALEAGDVIQVSVVSRGGRLSVTIGTENGAPLYRGTELPTSAFQVVIPESGTYRITVTGKNAAGKIHFTIQEDVQ